MEIILLLALIITINVADIDTLATAIAIAVAYVSSIGVTEYFCTFFTNVFVELFCMRRNKKRVLSMGSTIKGQLCHIQSDIIMCEKKGLCKSYDIALLVQKQALAKN